VTSIKDLKSDHKNARKRTDRSASLIAESLKRYGAARSIVIDEDGRILAGNGTVEGAKKAGITNVRIIEAEGDELIAVRRAGLSEDEKVGLALADNRSSDLSEWDHEMLRQLSEEHNLAPWFEDDELLAEVLDTVEGNTDPDDVPEPPEDPITKPGDLWILGNHRLLCGDSTDVLAVERLMDGQKADMVFTDPPYNVAFNGRSGKFDVIKNDDLDDQSFDELIAQTVSTIKLLAPKHYYIWCNWKFYATLQTKLDFKGCIVWAKNVFGLGKGYRHQHEFCLYHATLPDNIKNESDLWQVAKDSSYVHPTQKPVELSRRALGNHPDCKVVVDLFGGSGSTLIGCEQEHRHCRMMELDPTYCDVIVKRWEDFTGNTAVCVPSDQHFTEQQEAF
jgi:DNA modification methylase